MLTGGKLQRQLKRVLRLPLWSLVLVVLAFGLVFHVVSIPKQVLVEDNADRLFPERPRIRRQHASDKHIKSMLEGLLNDIMAAKPTKGLKAQGGSGLGLEQYDLIDRVYQNNIETIAYHDPNPNIYHLSEEFLAGGLHLPDDLVADLGKSHKKFVSSLHKAPRDTFKGSGYVLIGGGKFTWLSILSASNLRKTGSKLPFELIIPSLAEYEADICEHIIPDLGGRCVKLYELISNKYLESINGYQLKVLSILASSFANVIYLDSDNMPVENPDPVLKSDVFRQHGMILWPDFWRRVHHPKYYEIANIKVTDDIVRNVVDDITPPKKYITGKPNPKTEVAYHDRKGTVPDLSSESGQLIVNKISHFKTLSLSLFYNFYGPNQYYPLLGQDGAGEGDKDTFYAAANVLNEKVYQVKRGLNAFGTWINDQYLGSAMVQYDPIIDYQNVKQFMKENQKAKEYTPLLKYLDQQKNSKMFIHCNFPKFTPNLIDNSIYEGHKMFDGDDFNFEFTQWNVMHDYFCVKEIDFKFFPLTPSERNQFCARVSERMKVVTDADL